MNLLDFVVESNRIEGIVRLPTTDEVAAHRRFLRVKTVATKHLCAFVWTVARASLRAEEGMNVYVGGHVPLPGGQAVTCELENILGRIQRSTPWDTHIEYEQLHPFMDGNGRSGRVLWAWHCQQRGVDPFSLGFLHRFYYDTLANEQD